MSDILNFSLPIWFKLFEIFHKEFLTPSSVELVIQKNGTWTIDCLSKPLQPFHDWWLHICDKSDILLKKIFNGLDTRVILNDNQIWVNRLDLPHDNIDKRLLLLDLLFNI